MSRYAQNQEARNSVALQQVISVAVLARLPVLLSLTMIAKKFKVKITINPDNNGNFCMPTDP